MVEATGTREISVIGSAPQFGPETASTKPRLLTPLALEAIGVEQNAPYRFWNDLFEFQGVEVCARGSKHEAQLDKCRMMRTLPAMMAARALQLDGISTTQHKDVPLDELARRAGYKFGSSYQRTLKRVLESGIIKKRAKFASPNRYEWNFDQSDRERGRRWIGYNMRGAAELHKHAKLGRHFQHSTSKGGYTEHPGFIDHPKTPGSSYGKAILHALSDSGLFHGKNVLNKTAQIAIAKKVGCCVDTVRKWLRFYGVYHVYEMKRDPITGRMRRVKRFDAETGTHKCVREERRGPHPILKIVNQPGHWEKDGRVLTKHETGASWKQPENEIIFLGDSMLDPRTAVLETQRLLKIAEDNHFRRELWWDYVARIHGELLRDWIGTEKRRSTFWETCRMKCLDNGVPAIAVRLLFPQWRPPT